MGTRATVRAMVPPARLREIVTPEGVPLRFTVASAFDRILAFLVDLTVLVVCAGAVIVLVLLADAESALVIGILFSFLARNFYFMWFEQRWRGATPGKRAVGLRVIDANGGQLRVEAIVVRNLVRDLEVFLPLLFLVAPESVFWGFPRWTGWVAGAWLVIIPLIPLFNRDRRRVGDLVGGTMVIRSPRFTLLDDLVGKEVEAREESDTGPVFSAEQLSAYGIYELQVLEDVLRRGTEEETPKIFEQVSAKIGARIGWEGPRGDSEDFLRAFYSQLRAHLERRMLFGKRRKDKHSEEE